MSRTKREERVARLETVAHMCVGLAISMKGVAKVDHFHEHPGAIVFLIAAGAAVIVSGLFLERLEARFRHSKAFVPLGEGVVWWIVAWLSFASGKVAITAFEAFLGVAFLAVGFVRWRVTDVKSEKLVYRFRLMLGGSFLAIGVVVAVLHFAGKSSFGMNLAGAMSALTGTVLLALPRRFGMRESASASQSEPGPKPSETEGASPTTEPAPAGDGSGALPACAGSEDRD